MKTLTESVELHPISSCTSDKIGNSELRDILKEYYGNNDISYTADYYSEIWGEVLSYLDTCKLVTLLSGEILPQRKLPRTITLRNISSEVGLIKYIFNVTSFEEDLTN